MTQSTPFPLIVARLLALGGIAFISLFALDVFGPEIPLWEALVGLAIHLIPSAVLAGVLAVAWFWPVLGGAAFIALGVVPFVTLGNPVWVNLTLAGPFWLAGLLFVWGGWRGRGGPRDATTGPA